MTSHYLREYWLYSLQGEQPPFAICIKKEIDNRASWILNISAVMFQDALETPKRTYWTYQKRNERLDAFASRFWREVRIHGALVSDREYERFLDRLIYALTDPNPAKAGEIIND